MFRIHFQYSQNYQIQSSEFLQKQRLFQTLQPVQHMESELYTIQYYISQIIVYFIG